MRYVLIAAIGFFAFLIFGCSQQESSQKTDQAESKSGVQVSYKIPDPMSVPERITPESENDWDAKVSNKNAEIVEVLNILNPVAAYLTAAFEQYGDRLSEVTLDEWDDTVAQLTRANEIYEKAKVKMEQKKFDKSLFLQLEEAWQIYVKVGVAGVRTKTMVDSELEKMS
jgi:hypothetical protein